MAESYLLPASGKRLDVALTEAVLAGGRSVTRSELTRLIGEGRVRVEGLTAPPKTGWKVERAVTCTVDWPAPLSDVHEAEDIPLDIVWEDAHLLVVNKPRGLVVHPAPGHRGGTLVNALLHHCGAALSDANGAVRPGIVHRIDKDTSGLLVVAKTNEAHHRLAAQLARHNIVRIYHALVHGTFSELRGRIDAPIGRDSGNRQRMAVSDHGKPAVTHFEVLETFSGHSLLRCRLETGRTHQIRVHMQFVGHPVVGDPVYARGRRDFGVQGQLLHAAELHFGHPITGEALVCRAPLPAEWEPVLNALRGG